MTGRMLLLRLDLSGPGARGPADGDGGLTARWARQVYAPERYAQLVKRSQPMPRENRCTSSPRRQPRIRPEAAAMGLIPQQQTSTQGENA
jgi:hypothetical protein